MSEERLARIESRLDGLSDTVTTLVAGQTRLEAGQAKLEAGHARLEAGQAKLEAGQTRLETGQAKLEAGCAKLDTGQDELRRHMHVLHEEVIATIKAMDPAPLIAQSERRTMTAVADLREEVNRRLDPLEVAVRELTRRHPPQ